MPSLLLTTKLQVPQVRLERVRRPRLVARLQQGLPYKLILISAPAGYGKTTLIGDWLTNCEHLSAWVSLDKGDNDPIRFWAYILAALQSSFAAAGKTLPDLQPYDSPTAGQSLIIDLINELAKLQQPLIMVLDDYHEIDTQEIHQDLAFLLEHAPAHFHLVLATRADPPLPLARLRARSELLELRQLDLCFTFQEAADFLHHTMGLQVSSEVVTQINVRTEGWIAGLQMAALSMQNTDDVSALVTALKGEHHYIFDYFLEEVLERQPAEISNFLLYTSILDRFTASLCDALLTEQGETRTGCSSTAILEELERRNLFIIPLDHERCWYRYHSLFAELLKGYLQREHANRIPTLHGRASCWLEEQALIADAIHHAILAGEWERVVQLISKNVFALLDQNELSVVSRRLETLTHGKDRAQLWLYIGRAWLAAYTGRLGSVETLLSAAESEASSVPDEDARQTLRGHAAAIRAYVAWIAGKRDIAVQAAQESLECLNPADVMIRCQSATLLGLSLGDLHSRARAFEQALRYARESSISNISIFTYACWAHLLVLLGRLRDAHAVCKEALRLAQSTDPYQPFPALSHIYATLSMILLEWNDLEVALRTARQAVNIASRWEQADALHFAYTNLGEALFACGNVEEAFSVLHEAWQLAQRTSIWFEEITIAQEIDWYALQGNPEAALKGLRLAGLENERPSGGSRSSIAMLGTRAEVFLARKEYARALDEIAPVLDGMEKRGDVYYYVKSLVWQAKAYAGLGQKTQALASLQKALALAALEGYVRIFLAGGGDSLALLHHARAQGIMPDYIDRLLASLEGTAKAPISEPAANSQLIEPLSKRELEVIALLAEGCSDKRIAENLVISRETVHKHLKNVYGKLGVHSRTEAIASARELGLL